METLLVRMDSGELNGEFEGTLSSRAAVIPSMPCHKYMSASPVDPRFLLSAISRYITNELEKTRQAGLFNNNRSKQANRGKWSGELLRLIGQKCTTLIPRRDEVAFEDYVAGKRNKSNVTCEVARWYRKVRKFHV